jgi:hypothetical protein
MFHCSSSSPLFLSDGGLGREREMGLFPSLFLGELCGLNPIKKPLLGGAGEKDL